MKKIVKYLGIIFICLTAFVFNIKAEEKTIQTETIKTEKTGFLSFFWSITHTKFDFCN